MDLTLITDHWPTLAAGGTAIALWFWAYWLRVHLADTTQRLADSKVECARMDRALDLVSVRCELVESRLEVETMDRARLVDLVREWREEEATDRTGLVALVTAQLKAEALERKSLLDMILAFKLGTETGDLAPSLGAMMARLRPVTAEAAEEANRAEVPSPTVLPPDHKALIETALGGEPSEVFSA